MLGESGFKLGAGHRLTTRFLMLRACARFGQPPTWADEAPPHVINEAIAFEMIEMELDKR